MLNKTRKKSNVSPTEQESRKSHMKLAIWGAVLFYLLLYVVSRWFPVITGHTMQSDWAVILVSSVPLVIAIAYIVMDIFPKISAEVGGVKVSLEKALEYSNAETVHFDYRLDNSYFQKGRLKDLNNHIEELRTGSKSPSVLLVTLNGKMNVTFPALKQYVYGLAKLHSMRFIVFIDSTQTYLGFMPIEKFMIRYPKTSLEVILDDMLNDEGSARYWSNTFRLNTNINEDSIQRNIRDLALRQWKLIGLKRKDIDDLDFFDDERLENNRNIETEFDVIRLGAVTTRITKETEPIKAYQLMKQAGTNGVPVIDNAGRFLGMVIKDDLLNQLIEHFLTSTEQRQES